MSSKMDGQTNRLWHQKRLNVSLSLVRYLYRTHSEDAEGKSISMAYRKAVGVADQSLTYGEIVPQSFQQILAAVSGSQLPHGLEYRCRVFVDLGSGTGKACVTAALSPFGFTQCIGIELVPGLNEVAVQKRAELIGILDGAHLPDALPPRPTQDPARAHSELFDMIVATYRDILLCSDASEGNEDGFVLVDLLVSKMCLKYGHKRYKALCKPHKSFIKALQAHEDCLVLSPDVKRMALKNNVCANIYIEKEKEGEEGRARRSFDISAEDRAIFSTPSACRLDFLAADLFTIPWDLEADVVYCASLLFSDEMMERLTLQVLRLRPAAWFISLKPLNLADEERTRSIALREESFFRMSWQMARVYIYQKL